MNNKKTLIFDFDGTIADTFPYVLQIANTLADKFKFEIVEEFNLEKYKSMKLQDIFKEFDVPFWKLPFLVRDAQKELKKVIHKVKPIKDIVPALKSLSRSYQMIILSSNTKNNIASFLKSHSIDIFEEIHSGSSLFGKHRQINKIIKESNLKKEDTIYIGDEYRDVESARKSGIRVIAVTWGYNSKALLKKYKPNVIIDTPGKLIITIGES